MSGLPFAVLESASSGWEERISLKQNMTAIEPQVLADLITLSDDELRATIAKANKLLDARDKKRKEEATARARAIMEEAGLKFPEERAKRGRKGAS